MVNCPRGQFLHFGLALLLACATAPRAAAIEPGSPDPDTTVFKRPGLVTAGYVVLFDVPANGLARGFPKGEAKLLRLGARNAADPRAVRRELAAACGVTQATVTVAHAKIVAHQPPHSVFLRDSNLAWGIGFDDDGSRVVARLCATNAGEQRLAGVSRLLGPGDVLLVPLPPRRNGRVLVLALRALRFERDRFATQRFVTEHRTFYEGIEAMPMRNALQFPDERIGSKAQAPCP